MYIEYTQHLNSKEEILLLDYEENGIGDNINDLAHEYDVIDISETQTVKNKLFYSMCDVLSIDFDSLRDRLVSLPSEINFYPFVREHEVNLYTNIFDILLKHHILLTEPILVNNIYKTLKRPYEFEWNDKNITQIQSSYNRYLLKAAVRNVNDLLACFEKHLLLKKYADAIILGNTQLLDKNVFIAFVHQVLRTLMPIKIPAEEQLDDAQFQPFCVEEEFNDFLKGLTFLNAEERQFFCSDSHEFYVTSFMTILENSLNIKKCKNCGKYFVPYNRSDTIYCDRICPQDSTRTCKEYGTQKLWYEKLKNNESSRLYRNAYQAKQMLYIRNSEDAKLADVYKNSFEKFKKQSKQWKSDVKTGVKTEEEYIQWLKEVKEKKVL